MSKHGLLLPYHIKKFVVCRQIIDVNSDGLIAHYDFEHVDFER
jgi:hypothetical protein